jgi:hypothetical protein
MRFLRSLPPLSVAVLAAACLLSPPLTADYIELWNTTPPAENHWNYWDASPGGYGSPASWTSSGGYANSGHIYMPMNELVKWPAAENLYWPVFTIAGTGHREAYQELDLTKDPVLNILLSAAGGTVNLQGGQLYFFIGEWIGGVTPSAVFYRSTTPLVVNSTGWSLVNSSKVGKETDWDLLFRENSTRLASDLFFHPQQYGLVLVGAGPDPLSGDLHIDNFSSIPEPAALGGSLAGGLVLMVVFRRVRGS